MNDGQQSLAEVKEELLDEIHGVDHKVDTVEKRLLDKIDAVDHKVDGLHGELVQTRTELVHLINATSTALERRIDKKLDRLETRLEQMMDRKLDGMEDRVIKAAQTVADEAVQRMVGTIWEPAARRARLEREHSPHTRIEALSAIGQAPSPAGSSSNASSAAASGMSLLSWTKTND